MFITQAAGVAGNDELGDEPLLRGAAAAEAGSPAMPQDVIGRLVSCLIWAKLPTRPDDLRQPRAAFLVQRLRCRVTAALLCATMCVPIAVWLFVRGVQTYLDTEERTCASPLRDWLLGFLCLQLVWPVCMPLVTVLLLGWSLGAMLLLDEPPTCPELKVFVVEAVALEAVAAALFTAVGVAALTFRPLFHRLDKILSHSGTDPDILALIPEVDSHNVWADQECVICLSSREDLEVRWRQLLCGHGFHEPCLLEWLHKARRCPVCRLDLHTAYEHESGGGNSVVSAAANAPPAGPTQRRGYLPVSATESGAVAVVPEDHV